MAKKSCAFRKCGAFGKKEKATPSANAEDKKTEKNFTSGARTRVLNFAIHRSNHYSIPPSLDYEVKIAYIKTN